MTTPHNITEQTTPTGVSAPTARNTRATRGDSEHNTANGQGKRPQESPIAAAQTAPVRRAQRHPARGSWPGPFPGGALVGTPWELMQAVSDEMEQVLERLSGRFGPGLAARTGVAPPLRRVTSGVGAAASFAFAPQIEVVERPGGLTVRADLPGVDSNDIAVSLDHGVLTIQGERQQQQRDEQDGIVRTERAYGTFSRALPLPDGADLDQVEATFDGGVLEINIPVTRRQPERRIRVQSGRRRTQNQQ